MTLLEQLERRSGYATVFELLSARGPSDVTGFVVPVHVDAVQCVSRIWLASHVGDECIERFAPFIAHRDSATTVVMEGCVVGVKTTSLGGTPRTVFTGKTVLASVPVGDVALTVKATATLHEASSQVSDEHVFPVAAVTVTQPERVSVLVSDAFYGYQSSESNVGQIERWRHDVN